MSKQQNKDLSYQPQNKQWYGKQRIVINTNLSINLILSFYLMRTNNWTKTGKTMV